MSKRGGGGSSALVRRSGFGRMPRSMGTPGGQMKVYSYEFKPAFQYLQASQTAINVLSINGWNGPISTSIAATASTSGLAYNNDVLLGATFSLSDLASAASFVGLYDAYRIDSITCDATYMYPSNFAGPGTPGNPTLYHYWDQDSGLTAASVQAVLGKQGVQQFNPSPGQPSHRFTIRPLCAPTASTGGSGSNALLVPDHRHSQWINCATPAALHYGLQMLVTDFYAGGSGQCNQWRFQWTYRISFRGPRGLN